MLTSHHRECPYHFHTVSVPSRLTPLIQLVKPTLLVHLSDSIWSVSYVDMQVENTDDSHVYHPHPMNPQTITYASNKLIPCLGYSVGVGTIIGSSPTPHLVTDPPNMGGRFSMSPFSDEAAIITSSVIKQTVPINHMRVPPSHTISYELRSINWRDWISLA